MKVEQAVYLWVIFFLLNVMLFEYGVYESATTRAMDDSSFNPWLSPSFFHQLFGLELVIVIAILSAIFVWISGWKTPMTKRIGFGIPIIGGFIGFVHMMTCIGNLCQFYDILFVFPLCLVAIGIFTVALILRRWDGAALRKTCIIGTVAAAVLFVIALYHTFL